MANRIDGGGADSEAVRREMMLKWLAAHDRSTNSIYPPGHGSRTRKRRAPYYQNNPMWRVHPNRDV